MTWLSADFIEAVLKNLTDRIALAALFIALILIGLAKFAPSSGIGHWSVAHIITLYLIAIGAVCYLPTRHIIEGVDRGAANRRKKQSLKKHLESLGSDDQHILHNPINSRAMAFRVGTLHYHIAKSLEKRGLVYETEHQGFTIDKDVFDYLVEHPTLVGITKGS